MQSEALSVLAFLVSPLGFVSRLSVFAGIFALALAGCSNGQLTAEIKRLEAQVARSTELLDAATSQVESANAQYDRLSAEIDSLSEKLEESYADNAALREKSVSLQESLEAAQAKAREDELLEASQQSVDELSPTGTWVSIDGLLRLVCFDDGGWMLHTTEYPFSDAFKKWRGTSVYGGEVEAGYISRGRSPGAYTLPYTEEWSEYKRGRNTFSEGSFDEKKKSGLIKLYVESSEKARLVGGPSSDARLVRVAPDWKPKDGLPSNDATRASP